jgi:twinkle protein
MVISLERNGQADDPVERNTTKVRVLKNRFAGATGPACSLLYNKETGRMFEIDDPTEGLLL